MNSARFDELTAASGNFLAEIAEKVQREDPALHAVIDAALKSGESYTNVNIKIFESGISIRATINHIELCRRTRFWPKYGVAQVLQ